MPERWITTHTGWTMWVCGGCGTYNRREYLSCKWCQLYRDMLPDEGGGPEPLVLSPYIADVTEDEEVPFELHPMEES